MKCAIWLASDLLRLRGGCEGWIVMKLDRKAVLFCQVILSILLKRQRRMVLCFSLSHILLHLTVLL